MQRIPAVAGSFYPAQAQQLHDNVNDYLRGVDAIGKVPKAIIVPHAGYIYSGPVAATAYARLIPAADTITRVILLGPSHRYAFSGMAVTSALAYSSPLGDVPLDRAATDLILQLPFVECLDAAHVPEHSLEVQLPFLQQVLQNFTLVPIVCGDASADEVAIVLEQLWGGDETLIVISSDLSHYHDYATAQNLDKLTSHLIETLQYRHISGENACGKVPVCGLLRLLEHKGLSIKTIDLRNSGDTAGDKERVVGYGAYVVD